MFVKYPKDGISATDKAAVNAAIENAVSANPELQKCKVFVSKSLRDRVEHGQVVYENKPGFAINFWKRAKTIHIDRND